MTYAYKISSNGQNTELIVVSFVTVGSIITSSEGCKIKRSICNLVMYWQDSERVQGVNKPLIFSFFEKGAYQNKRKLATAEYAHAIKRKIVYLKIFYPLESQSESKRFLSRLASYDWLPNKAQFGPVDWVYARMYVFLMLKAKLFQLFQFL